MSLFNCQLKSVFSHNEVFPPFFTFFESLYIVAIGMSRKKTHKFFGNEGGVQKKRLGSSSRCVNQGDERTGQISEKDLYLKRDR